jgi:DNA uptake protein ComE-like DNA-binding protein
VIYLVVRLGKLQKIFQKTNSLDRLLILVVLIGAVVLVASLFRGILLDRQVQVEFMQGDTSTAIEGKNMIFVDIEGAVINKGVYDFPEGSRIKDVLIRAGGLTEEADREFCEKNINQAEEIKDGQKIYIPFAKNTNTQQGYMEASLASKKISINSATVVELDTLWGIGAARAESIVKNRPYQSIDELVTKGVLTKTLVDRNRELLSVY